MKIPYLVAVNMPAASKGSGSPSGRLMFQPDAENVHGCVDIAIMRCPAVGAFPAPHSKRTHAFRAAGGYRPTSRARLGTVSFVGFNKNGSVPSGLVAEHVSELRPSSIKNRLCKSRLGQTSGVHIADNDQTIFADNLGGLLVKVVAASVRDLRVNSSHTVFVSCPLRNSQACFVFAIVPQVGDLRSVTHGRKRGQAKVYADRSVSSGQIVFYLALKDDIPAPTRVLRKTPSLKLSINFSGLPEAEAALQIYSGISIDPGCARDEGYPAQRTPAAETRSKTRASPVLIAGLDEMAADLADRIGVQHQISSNPRGEFDQVEGSGKPARGSALTALFCFSLRSDTEIPDLVTRDRMAAQVPVAALDAILEADNAQRGPRSVASDQVKSASSDCRPVARSPFVSRSAANFNIRAAA